MIQRENCDTELKIEYNGNTTIMNKETKQMKIYNGDKDFCFENCKYHFTSDSACDGSYVIKIKSEEKNLFFGENPTILCINTTNYYNYTDKTELTNVTFVHFDVSNYNSNSELYVYLSHDQYPSKSNSVVSEWTVPANSTGKFDIPDYEAWFCLNCNYYLTLASSNDHKDDDKKILDNITINIYYSFEPSQPDTTTIVLWSLMGISVTLALTVLSVIFVKGCMILMDKRAERKKKAEEAKSQNQPLLENTDAATTTTGAADSTVG